MITKDKDWNWYEPENQDAICAPEQLMTCVYRGDRNEVVIRQKEDPWMGEEGDTVIFLSPDNAFRTGQMLIRLALEMGALPRADGEQEASAAQPQQEAQPPTRPENEPGPLLRVMQSEAAE